VCGGAVPATGTWRPPFVQAYTLSPRGIGDHERDEQRRAHDREDERRDGEDLAHDEALGSGRAGEGVVGEGDLELGGV